MAEVDLERLVLPTLLALLVLGAFIILVTNGGGGETAVAPTPVPKSDPASKKTSAKPAASATSAPAAQRFVEVQAGDTASAIADRTGITVDRLRDLNPSIDASSLRPGQTLKLAP
jgi:LysM repeat protein